MNYPITRNGDLIYTFTHASGTLTTRILGESVVDLQVTLPEYFEFLTGDMLTIAGEGNFILTKPDFQQLASNRYEYKLKFVAEHYQLANTQFMFYDENNQLTKGDFFLTENLLGFVGHVVKNANRNSFGWAVGTVQDSDYINMNFSGDNCLNVLSRLSTDFGVEFWVSGKTINFSKKGANSGLSFRYGKGNGLRSLTRNESEKKPVTRLFVFGSNKNLPEDYRGFGRRLLMPESDGLYLEKNVLQHGINEHTEIFDIKPERTGTITDVAGDIYTFTDSTIDFDLNNHLLQGISAKVHFQTGQLAGYSFEIRENGYNHTTKTVTINQNQDETAWVLPSELLRPQVGDKYIFIDVSMPDSYVEAAEQKLKTEAQAWIDQHSIRKVKYVAPTDPLYLKNNAITVNLGDYVNIQMVEGGIDSDIRVTGRIVSLENLHDQQLELQDNVNISALIQQVHYQKEVERAITRNQLSNAARSRLNWRTSQETLSMIFNPATGKMDGDKIEAGTITTQHLSVGTYSQNFRLVGVTFEPGYDGDNTKLGWTSGTLVHNIFEENNGIWYITGGVVSGLEVSKAYYLYFKCDKSSQDTEIIVTQGRLKVDEYVGFYTLWVGILNSVIDGWRAFTSTYGLTTINGAQMSTGFMRNTLGDPILDLDNRVFYGSFRFGNTGEDIQEAFDVVRTEVENAVLEAENAASTALRAAAITDYLFTTIDGNIVATGTLLVGNAFGNNAGITGVGSASDSVFIWGGSDYASRNSAPIQLKRNGDAIFKQIQAEGGKIGPFTITSHALTYGDSSVSNNKYMTLDVLKEVRMGQTQTNTNNRREIILSADNSQRPYLMRLENTFTGYGYNFGLGISVDGGILGDVALTVEKGGTYLLGSVHFGSGGLSKTTSNYSMTKNDTAILVASGLIITLPTAPSAGRIVYIVMDTFGGTTVRTTNGTRIYARDYYGSGGTQIIVAAPGIQLMYFNTGWYKIG